MKVGKNLTYMLVSRSIPIRMDRYDENNVKEKCFQDAAYKLMHGSISGRSRC
jgi:hypothetical protein